jgi:hypothetical protein
MKFIPILALHLTINNNVAATMITRRNTMHKNTRSILGNSSQQGKKKTFTTKRKTFSTKRSIFFKRKTFTTNKT